MDPPPQRPSRPAQLPPNIPLPRSRQGVAAPQIPQSGSRSGRPAPAIPSSDQRPARPKVPAGLEMMQRSKSSPQIFHKPQQIDTIPPQQVNAIPSLPNSTVEKMQQRLEQMKIQQQLKSHIPTSTAAIPRKGSDPSLATPMRSTSLEQQDPRHVLVSSKSTPALSRGGGGDSSSREKVYKQNQEAQSKGPERQIPAEKSDPQASIPLESEPDPFIRISDDYRYSLARTLKNIGMVAEPPTKQDFLTEEGYYSWMDRTEQIGEDPRLALCVSEMILLWDLDHPFMDESHLQTKSQKAAVSKPFQTTLNLVVRIIEARGLLRDSKNRNPNCLTVIEYPQQNLGDKGRFETAVVMDTTTPMWDQQITLTVNNLMDPIQVTVFQRKEKSGIFGDDVRDDFLGCIKLNVQELISASAKNGFIDQWYQLNNTDCKDKYRNRQVAGEIRIEVEMGGVIGEQGAALDDMNVPQELRQLKELQHRLITYKVNLKTVYYLLISAVVQLDLCIPEGKDITKVNMSKVPYRLSEEGEFVLRQFTKVWSITDVFKKMKFLECIFEFYKRQRLHASALTVAFKSLHEGIWRKGTIWLPNYEQPALFDLFSNIEVYLTEQIRKFKEFFPAIKPYDKDQVDYICRSLDCVVMLTRTIDKNPFFLNEVEGSISVKTDKAFDVPDEDPQVTNQQIGISDLDYRDGKFSFTEKLLGILQSKVVLRFQQLNEIASPFAGKETVATAVVKCKELARLMTEDVEEDRQVYRKAFARELDIVPLSVKTYLKYFVLEMENLMELLRKSKGVFIAPATEEATVEPDNASIQVPKNEEELLTTAFQLMDNVRMMRESWTKYAPDNQLNVSAWFTPFINRWLILTEGKTVEWAENAVKVDTLVRPEGQEYTSSVTDLFQAIFQSLNSVQKTLAGWATERQVASFTTRFGKISFSAIEHYCQTLQKKTAEKSSSTTDSTSSDTPIKGIIDWLGSNSKTPVNASETIKSDVKDFDCIFLANVQALNKKLTSLYKEMNGSLVKRAVDQWREDKKKTQTTSTSEGVCGVLKIQIIAADDLKQKPGIMGGSPDPYFVIKLKENGDEVGRTHCCQATVNPRYVSMNPMLDVLAATQNLTKRKLYPFVMDQPCVIVPVSDLTELHLVARHRQEASTFQFMSSATDPVLCQGILRLTRDDFSSKDHRLSKWVKMNPQARVLVELKLLHQGMPIDRSSTSAEDSEFGVAGVEDLDFWFLKMENATIFSRDSTVRNLSQKLYTSIEPLLTKSLKAISTSPNTTPATEVTEAEADQALEPATNYLNHNFTVIASKLPGRVAQHVIYRIWIDVILRILVHHLAPLSYKADSSPAGTTLLGRILDQRQVGLIRHWLNLLSAFFHAGGVDLGLPTDVLEKGSHLYQECQILIRYYWLTLADLEQTAKTQCVVKARNGEWALLRLLRARTLWDSGSPVLEQAKATVSDLNRRREDFIEAGSIIL